MDRLTATMKRPRKQPKLRMGRPPRDMAGEVEERILKAARGVFLESGLQGASIDEIARRAHAGKPTIYARYATKEALFAGVIHHSAASIRTQFASDPPTGDTVEDRLVSVGASILKRLLAGDTIEFMRLAAGEARRFPDLANVGRAVRERAAQTATGVLREVAASSEIGAFPALASGSLESTTLFFLDLVVSRFLLRALLGESVRHLRAEIDTHVARSVAFFLAACRRYAVE